MLQGASTDGHGTIVIIAAYGVYAAFWIRFFPAHAGLVAGPDGGPR